MDASTLNADAAVASALFVAIGIGVSGFFNWRAIVASEKNLRRQVSATREAAKIQAHATAVSVSRQGWINALRDEISTLLSDIHYLMSIRSGTDLLNDEIARENARTRRKYVLLSFYKIQLLLNPNEHDHQTFVGLIEEIMEAGVLTESDLVNVVSQSQAILKREWVRVKIGD